MEYSLIDEYHWFQAFYVYMLPDKNKTKTKMLPAFTKNASENGNNIFCRAKMKIMVYVSVTLYIPGWFSFKCFEFNLDTISNN